MSTYIKINRVVTILTILAWGYGVFTFTPIITSIASLFYLGWSWSANWRDNGRYV